MQYEVEAAPYFQPMSHDDNDSVFDEEFQRGNLPATAAYYSGQYAAPPANNNYANTGDFHGDVSSGHNNNAARMRAPHQQKSAIYQQAQLQQQHHQQQGDHSVSAASLGGPQVIGVARQEGGGLQNIIMSPASQAPLAQRRQRESASSLHHDSAPVFEAPRFLHQLQSQLIVGEGAGYTLTTKVAPFNDPSLRVEWLRNGAAITSGSRINCKFERGFAILDVVHSIAQDSGNYTCYARSSSGSCHTSACRVEVIADSGVVSETQLPDAEMVNSISRIEAYLASNAPTRREEADPSDNQPARFLKPLGTQAVINVREGKAVHLETVVSPASDPKLVVNWYKNGTPLSMSCRSTFVLDRGFAILDIVDVNSDDSGQYFCVVQNRLAQVQSNIVTVKVIQDASIITQSQLPPESVDYLINMDVPNEQDLRLTGDRYQETTEIDGPPQFDKMPENVETKENGPAKFLVRVSGHPKPTIMWFMDQDMLSPTTSCRIFNDGAINYLEFSRCECFGSHVITVVARNGFGEVSAQAHLTVIASEDFRPELRHVMPEFQLKKRNDSATDSSLPPARLKRVDRGDINVNRANKQEVNEAENLYQNIYSRLRRSERAFGSEEMNNLSVAMQENVVISNKPKPVSTQPPSYQSISTAPAHNQPASAAPPAQQFQPANKAAGSAPQSVHYQPSQQQQQQQQHQLPQIQPQQQFTTPHSFGQTSQPQQQQQQNYQPQLQQQYPVQQQQFQLPQQQFSAHQQLPPQQQQQQQQPQFQPYQLQAQFGQQSAPLQAPHQHQTHPQPTHVIPQHNFQYQPQQFQQAPQQYTNMGQQPAIQQQYQVVGPAQQHQLSGAAPQFNQGYQQGFTTSPTGARIQPGSPNPMPGNSSPYALETGAFEPQYFRAINDQGQTFN